MRLAESLTFIHGGLNENLFQYKRNSVAACKKFEAQKKFFDLFHLYVNSLFVLTSFSLNLLTQNSVPSGKPVPKHARKLHKALKVYIYSENNKSFNIHVSVGKPKPLNTKLTVFYQPLRTTYIQTNWTISLQSK